MLVVTQATNAAVRFAVPILWHEYTREQLDNSPAGMRVSAKSLPPEVKTVRLVEIQGVDLNPCCGTHVPTTAALQMVKFLRAEPVCTAPVVSMRFVRLSDHQLSEGFSTQRPRNSVDWHVTAMDVLSQYTILSTQVKGGRTLLHFGAGTRLLMALADASLRDRGKSCCSVAHGV